MSDHVYRISEIVGTSEEEIDDAIRNGISRAASTNRGLDWFEVGQVRGHIGLFRFEGVAPGASMPV